MGQATHEHHPGPGTSMGLSQPPRPSHFPLVRLLQLIVLLQSERCPNARRMAEICEVSRRTIYRDLATLDEAGIQVVYRPDRQGYQLARSMLLTSLRIEEQEAIALLVLTRNWNAHEDLGLSRAAGTAVDKLLQGLPEPLRRNLLALSEVVGDSPPRDEEKADSPGIHALVLKSLASRHQVRVWIRNCEGEPAESIKIAVYRLSRIDGQWCLIGRSSRDCNVCLIPLQKVERAECTGEVYTIPPRFNLERFLTQFRPSVEDLPSAQVG